MNRELTLSVIIAAYNAGLFIEKLIDTIPSSDEVEIIVVNDGCTDSTADVVSKLALQDTRIKLFCQKNAGVSVARNRGIQEAKGQWLMFADADDWFDQTQMNCLIEQLRDVDNDAGVVNFGVRHVFASKSIEHWVAEQTITMEEFLGKGFFMEASWNYAFRRSVIEKFHIRFPEGIINTEDQNFNLKAMVASTKIVSFNLVVYNYNKMNEESASQKKHKKEWTEAPVLSALDLVEFCDAHQLPVKLIKGNVAHLLYQFFRDHTSEITMCERSKVYKAAYRKLCKTVPGFASYKKYRIPYYNMKLGMLLFKFHEILKK